MGSPGQHHRQAHAGDAHSNPPPPPEPSNDTGIIPSIKSPVLEGIDHLTPDNVDIFTLDAVAALKLLCRGTQLLVDMTGDVPPTPAARSPGVYAPPAQVTTTPEKPRALSVPGFTSRNENDHIDGVPFTKTPMGSPEAHMHEPIVHGNTSQPAAIQYAALVRKFYSKRPPPISLEEYLSRMHKYCPMSTAVYLATSHYITHLAIKEKICPVTPRNVHRLLLSGLRIAMKALEDLSWPHSRFAKVGGISEPELARLEVGFCFLMDFGLKVDAEMLTEEAQNLVRMNNSNGVVENDIDAIFQLKLPEPKHKSQQALSDTTNEGGSSSGLSLPRSTAEKRKASSSLPMRPVQVGGIGIIGQS